MGAGFAVKTNMLSKSFEGKEVVRNCNMNVKKNTIYCLVGKNGAGKTTIFKLLLGFLSPTSGQASILDMDSETDNLHILKRTGSVIENPVFYEHLSAIQNLKIHLEYMGAKNISDIDDVLAKVGLINTGGQPVSTFSLGMRQRLAIARAIVHKPELLILDEPINGMDPIGIREMRDLFHSLSQQNITILMSSHILSEVEQVADYIGFIVDGSIVCEERPQDILARNPGGVEDYFMKILQRGIAR